MITFRRLANEYLEWCAIHRAERSLEWYKGPIDAFLTHLGDEANDEAIEMKPYQLIKWVDGHKTWGDTHKRNNIVAIQRVFSWGAEMGYLDINPLQKVKKPAAKRRDNPMPEKAFQDMMDKMPETDPFKDFLLFAWLSGARPQEIRHIEARHVSLANACINFPAAESKGKKYARAIYLDGKTLEIARKLVALHPEGKIFRNSKGNEWTKEAVCDRMRRLSKATGTHFAAYDARHSFCQRLLEKEVNTVTVSELMGHRGTAMVSSVYSHMSHANDHLKDTLKKLSA